MRVHIIIDDVVVNTIESDTLVHPDGLLMVEATATSEIGDVWDGEVFTRPAPPAVDPEVAIAAKWEAIKVERDRRLLTGGYPVADHWFHSDLISRSQHLSNARKADLVAAAGGDMDAQFMLGPYPMQVKSMDAGLLPMTATMAHTIMAAAEVQELMTYGAALAHKAALEASETPWAYDFSGGWPAICGAA